MHNNNEGCMASAAGTQREDRTQKGNNNDNNIIIKVILACPLFLLMVLISVCVAGQGWLLIGGEWCSAAIRRQRERISEDGQRECVHGLRSLSSEPCFAHETPEHCPMNGLIQPSLHKTAAAIVQTQAPPPNKVLSLQHIFHLHH
jgi:hypothetical protein